MHDKTETSEAKMKLWLGRDPWEKQQAWHPYQMGFMAGGNWSQNTSRCTQHAQVRVTRNKQGHIYTYVQGHIYTYVQWPYTYMYKVEVRGSTYGHYRSRGWGMTKTGPSKADQGKEAFSLEGRRTVTVKLVHRRLKGAFLPDWVEGSVGGTGKTRGCVHRVEVSTRMQEQWSYGKFLSKGVTVVIDSGGLRG